MHLLGVNLSALSGALDDPDLPDLVLDDPDLPILQFCSSTVL